MKDTESSEWDSPHEKGLRFVIQFGGSFGGNSWTKALASQKLIQDDTSEGMANQNDFGLGEPAMGALRNK